jgi:hypothetical protein
MTSSALVNGSSLNFNILSLDETVVPPTYKAVGFNVIFVVADPPTNQLKLESVLF